MIRIFLPLLCAALGFATTSCSQSEGPFAPTAAPASPPPSSSVAVSSPPDSLQTPALDQGSTPPGSPGSQASGSQSPEEQNPAAPASAPAERRASRLIGMPVVAVDGSPLGEVKDIILDSDGRATHVVIACFVQSQAGRLTAVPWDTVIARITDARVVLDGANLQGAPSFTPDEWPDLDDPAWRAIADAYWRKVARPPVAAHRGTAIDSTSRQRARPPRDSDGDGD